MSNKTETLGLHSSQVDVSVTVNVEPRISIAGSATRQDARANSCTKNSSTPNMANRSAVRTKAYRLREAKKGRKEITIWIPADTSVQNRFREIAQALLNKNLSEAKFLKKTRTLVE